MDKILVELDRLRNSLRNVEYEHIYELIRSLRYKILPTALLKKGWFIDRVRLNQPADVLFTRKDEISYITDQYVLQNCVDFGRANVKGQGIFYGAVLSPEIEQPRLSAYLETSKIYKHLERFPMAPENQNLTETFTVSRWRILEDIEVLEMIFSEEALKVSHYAQESLKNQLNNLKGHERIQHFIEQCTFFSNEFARNDIEQGENYKYKISSAYINYIWNQTDFKGITYPSVATKYKGQNVALMPEFVDKYLELESCLLCKFERINGVNLPIDNSHLCTDLGNDQMDFQWREDPK